MGRGDKSKNKLTISVSLVLINKVQSTYFWYYIPAAGNRLGQGEVGSLSVEKTDK